MVHLLRKWRGAGMWWSRRCTVCNLKPGPRRTFAAPSSVKMNVRPLLRAPGLLILNDRGCSGSARWAMRLSGNSPGSKPGKNNSAPTTPSTGRLQSMTTIAKVRGRNGELCDQVPRVRTRPSLLETRSVTKFLYTLVPANGKVRSNTTASVQPPGQTIGHAMTDHSRAIVMPGLVNRLFSLSTTPC